MERKKKQDKKKKRCVSFGELRCPGADMMLDKVLHDDGGEGGETIIQHIGLQEVEEEGPVVITCVK